MMWYWVGLAALWASAFVAGAVIGAFSYRRVIARRERQEAQAKELERQRVIHDTKRVSIARPGTKSGRVSKASIDMGASHMGQSNREV